MRLGKYLGRMGTIKHIFWVTIAPPPESLNIVFNSAGAVEEEGEDLSEEPRREPV